jgi:plastocyanin
LEKTMKKRLGRLWIPGVLVLGMVLVETCPAQSAPAEDSVVAVVAEAAGLPQVPPSQWPSFGTFWRWQGGRLTAPTPCRPLDPTTPVYALPNGQFLADDSAGDILLVTSEALLQTQLDALLQLIARLEESSLNAEMDAMSSLGGEFYPLDAGGPLYGENYSSSDLWLEIVAVTNGPSGMVSADFVVHPPELEAGQAFDLFMTTNLSAQAPGLNLTNWDWVRRAQPGQTNVTISDLTADQAFFLAARINDLDGDWMSDAYEQLRSHTDPNSPDGPSILFQPLSQTVDRGDTVTFTVVAEGASPLRYQWWWGEEALTGQTNSSLTLVGVGFEQQGDYRVEITSPAGVVGVEQQRDADGAKRGMAAPGHADRGAAGLCSAQRNHVLRRFEGGIARDHADRGRVGDQAGWVFPGCNAGGDGDAGLRNGRRILSGVYHLG